MSEQKGGVLNKLLARIRQKSPNRQDETGSLADLRKEYTSLKSILGSLNAYDLTTKQYGKELKQVEEKILLTIHEPFLKGFLGYYINEGFDIDEILDAQETGDWEKPIREHLKSRIIRVNFALKEGPIKGSELFKWIVEVSRLKFDHKEDITINIASGIKEGLSREIPDRLFDQSIGQIENRTELLKKDVANIFIMPDFNSSIKLFASVINTVEGGYEWFERVFDESSAKV